MKIKDVNNIIDQHIEQPINIFLKKWNIDSIQTHYEEKYDKYNGSSKCSISFKLKNMFIDDKTVLLYNTSSRCWNHFDIIDLSTQEIYYKTRIAFLENCYKLNITDYNAFLKDIIKLYKAIEPWTKKFYCNMHRKVFKKLP